ncbi:MAG: biotin transporter BioY [Planctomycetota bacterium]
MPTPITDTAAQEEASIRALLQMASPLAGAGLVAFAAQVSVPIGDYGVPFTFGDLAVIVVAYGLGPKRGLLGIAIYLVAGAIGIPVYAGGGNGLAHLFGVTSGYLLGYLACQPVVGRIIRRRDGSLRGWLATILAFLAAQSIIYALGVTLMWLIKDGATLRGSIWNGMVIFLPFVPVKGAIAILIARMAAPWAMRNIW